MEPLIEEQSAALIAADPIQKWREIPITTAMTPAAKVAAVRMNAFGSLYWFVKYVLGRNRLSPALHGMIARDMERDSLRLSLEIPRDMFKTTLASEGAPIWWALPFTDRDEELMRSLGYGDGWIRWMYRAHNVNNRTLIASETIDNAMKIGTRIAGHYESNALYRELFPSIIPRSSMENPSNARKKRWNSKSLTQNRTESHGEGTYDFIGVKGALQSRHYDRQVIDDPVGEKAIKSDLVMHDTIEWIKKLSGALDSDPNDPDKLNDQLFIGNRWSQRDVGAWLRDTQPDMNFITHSAEGGCCALHPPGHSIFPEEFSMKKLAELRQVWGSYNYSAQYLNNPVDPEAVRFRLSWLRRYTIIPRILESGVTIANSQQLSHALTPAEVLRQQGRMENAGHTPQRLISTLSHEVQSGESIDDIRAGLLERVAILDPNHGEQRGRARHAIVVLGFYNNPPAPRRIYLLDCWAEASSHDKMIDRLIGTRADDPGLAFKWRVHHIYLESEVAGQQGWLRYFKEKVANMGVKASFTIRPLKTNKSAGAKDERIVGMEPIYENGLLWIPRSGGGVDQFLGEYETYPNGRTVDILDVMGYSAQCWGQSSPERTRDFVRTELSRRAMMIQSVGVAGY